MLPSAGSRGERGLMSGWLNPSRVKGEDTSPGEDWSAKEFGFPAPEDTAAECWSWSIVTVPESEL